MNDVLWNLEHTRSAVGLHFERCISPERSFRSLDLKHNPGFHCFTLRETMKSAKLEFCVVKIHGTLVLNSIRCQLQKGI